jgi:secondary thiamine-phosphate synthase enzyme
MAFAAEGAPTDLPPLGRAARLGSALVVRQRRLVVHTTRAAEFVDVTAPVQRIVTAAALGLGVVVVATRHTTTGLLVNEHEPLLLQDLEGLFERLAPSHACYAHDDPARRVVNLTAHERTNGHAHARAALLRSSETLAVAGGVLQLGQWQRVFLVEFDGGQRRELTVCLIGQTGRPRRHLSRASRR